MLAQAECELKFRDPCGGEKLLKFDQVKLAGIMSRFVNGNKQFTSTDETKNEKLEGLCLALS